MVHNFAGVFLFLSILSSIITGVSDLLPIWVAGLFAWLGGLLLINRLSRGQLIQTGLLSMTGVSCLLYVWQNTGQIKIDWAMTANQNIVALIIGISFLKLVTQARTADNEQLPYGRDALRKTLFGIHLFCSILNMSAVIIAGDRLTRSHALKKAQFIILSRAFFTAAFWSPFYAAMAAALTFVPDIRIGVILLTGIPLALIAHWLTLKELDIDAEQFEGYPIHFESLLVPAVLVILVLFFHEIFPTLGTLMSITILAPLLTLVILLKRVGIEDGFLSLMSHIIKRLPEMAGEITLFLSAGLLAAGFGEFFKFFDIGLPFSAFTGFEAGICLVFISIFAFAGVHPIILIGILVPWLMPLNPPPDLLAMVFLFAWGIGLGSSPFSGTHLTMQGRYLVKAMDIVRWNLPHAIKMLFFALLALQLLYYNLTG